ncbi:MAG: hypothetical protein PHS57_09355 [Alphaproteobacteria bacterium]|nr:hypothetical protein [Alphaproteobacteria bacterium]
MSKSRLGLAVSFFALAVGVAPGAHAADTAAALDALQKQIDALQKQLAELKAAQAKADREEKAERVVSQKEEPSPSEGSLRGVIKAKTGVDVTMGGFINASTIFRTKNESADAGSNFNTMIPFNNAANAHQSEFRESARGSRLSLKAVGKPGKDATLTGYFEFDFLGAGSTSTQTQTNSYTPRVRHLFASYDDSASGWRMVAGQTWSLATMNAEGINPFKQNIPMVQDSGFLPGVNFTRVPQLRVVKDFKDRHVSIGLSAESPQMATAGICTSSTATSIGNSPSTGTNPCSGATTAYSLVGAAFSGNLQGSITTDIAPDMIVKATYDPGWGHYEVFGLTRVFHGLSGANNHNNMAFGGGIGAGASLPIVPKKVDLRANVLVGKGVGRYGAAQLPDVSVASDGKLKPLSQYTAMLGVVGRPSPSWDVFLYAGMEQAFRHSVAGVTNNVYGYGNFGVDNRGCSTSGSTTCYAQTSSVWQVTAGLWHVFYEGDYGQAKIGLQHSWTRRNAFSDANGINPHGIQNISLLAIRYAPF